MEGFSRNLKRGLGLGLALGTFDIGLRHTVLRKFTEGLPEH